MESSEEIRHYLHAHPEISGKETETAEYLIKYLSRCSPSNIYRDDRSNGFIVRFSGRRKGPSCLFRTELDAIPVTEKSNVPYRSLKCGVGHLCGHDGHMAILCEVAARIASKGISSGNMYLMFQPAEETGKGAERMAEFAKEKKINCDYCFALHNMPGYPTGSIIIYEGTYAFASAGIEISFTGRPSHAATPEFAETPTDNIFSIIKDLEKRNKPDCFSTIISVNIGEENYGITPGNGKLCLTARAATDKNLKDYINHIINISKENAGSLKIATAIKDFFPATVNDKKANDKVIEAAKETGGKVIIAPEPQKASDDFAFMRSDNECSFFDIGCGEDHAPLHSENFDFDDSLIKTGADIICSVYQRCQQDL
ncbi:MAG: amidohydrolase [Bacteroidales bacterium]|jgi:amidohydrolase|nr:amidohydrolase [Bacteroidales bacterium]